MSTKAISEITNETKEEIRKKSALALPDSPSASGLKAYDIKYALTAPILDDHCSLMSIIEKLIDECEQMREDFENRISLLESASDILI